MLYLLLLLLVVEKRAQNDWMGGSGLQGPVTNWGTQYYQGDSITVATEGQVSLRATQWDYGKWIRHRVELNSGIPECTQGLMPADIDNDGIKDLVAHTNDTAVWYKHDGNYNFTKNIIGPANDSGEITLCVFPTDMDKDGNIDVLVATKGIGVGWFENNLPGTWLYHKIDSSIGYHRVSSADIDLDKNMDIIAVDNTINNTYGKINVFKNDGSQNFSMVQSINASGSNEEGWRVYTVDFNKDRYPDIYSVGGQTVVYLNDGTGHFTQSFYADIWGSTIDFDGGWPSDINMDGSMDLVCAAINAVDSGFHAFIGDGTGWNFTYQKLTGAMRPYIDGSIARDIDLDGLPDIAGTLSAVGWLRQTGNLTFTLYNIEGFGSPAHWIYAASIGNKCIPSIDLIVTRQSEHIVYENDMFERFASPGFLTSSIIQLADTTKSLMYFGWNACVPGDSTLAFWWRADTIAGNITGQPWNGPYYATNNVDSIVLSATPCAQFFQYRAGLWQQELPVDIPTLFEAWVSFDTCQPAAIEEKTVTKEVSLKIIGNQILLLPDKNINDVKLSIYNTAGELVQIVYKGPIDKTKSYKFIPELKVKGVYLVTLRYSGKTETVKLVKSR